MCNCSVLVVARHNEDAAWLRDLQMPVMVMDKAAGNFGREALSYLHWITEHYYTLDLDRCTCFAQGQIGGMQMRGVQGTVYNTLSLTNPAQDVRVGCTQINGSSHTQHADRRGSAAATT